MPQISAAFVASEPWQSTRPESLVVCCSDGRWHAQVEEFVRTQVSIRADLYAIPGGPAGFNPRSSSFYERKVSETAFDFLVVHHCLESIWLIAHHDCAWYRAQFEHLDPKQLLRRQLLDLDHVAQTMRDRYAHIEVHRIYASLADGRVVFNPLGDNAWWSMDLK